VSAYNSLVQEGPKVMLFYDGRSAGEVEAVTCVAISSDYGRTFHKPSLGLVSPRRSHLRAALYTSLKQERC
jgi:hypothetical protein